MAQERRGPIATGPSISACALNLEGQIEVAEVRRVGDKVADCHIGASHFVPPAWSPVASPPARYPRVKSSGRQAAEGARATGGLQRRQTTPKREVMLKRSGCPQQLTHGSMCSLREKASVSPCPDLHWAGLFILHAAAGSLVTPYPSAVAVAASAASGAAASGASSTCD
jgi:hypothetical protein